MVAVQTADVEEHGVAQTVTYEDNRGNILATDSFHYTCCRQKP